MKTTNLETSTPRGKLKFTCIQCGNIYYRYPSHITKTCSRSCSAKNRGMNLGEEARKKQKKFVSGMLKKKWAEDKEYRAKMINATSGENNHLWVGDKVSYSALHQWIKKYGKADKCENCHTKLAKKYEWANLSGKYKRSRDDFVMLCVSCHSALDRSRPIWSKLIESEIKKARIIELESLCEIVKAKIANEKKWHNDTDDDQWFVKGIELV